MEALIILFGLFFGMPLLVLVATDWAIGVQNTYEGMKPKPKMPTPPELPR